MLEREVAIMKKCRHRNVVALYEVIDDPELECMYLVMQYVEHGPLVRLSPTGTLDKPLDPATVAGYARQLCAGLQYLHKHGVIHRDIKPDNILLGQNDQVYLADFGTAELFENDEDSFENATRGIAGTRGTLAFMAPELLQTTDGGNVDGEAVDVWALGITLYVLLFGRMPWRSMNNKSDLLDHITDSPIDIPMSVAPYTTYTPNDEGRRSVPREDDESPEPDELPGQAVEPPAVTDEASGTTLIVEITVAAAPEDPLSYAPQAAKDASPVNPDDSRDFGAPPSAAHPSPTVVFGSSPALLQPVPQRSGSSSHLCISTMDDEHRHSESTLGFSEALPEHVDGERNELLVPLWAQLLSVMLIRDPKRRAKLPAVREGVLKILAKASSQAYAVDPRSPTKQTDRVCPITTVQRALPLPTAPR
jgi:serine/threonine protein kinase